MRVINLIDWLSTQDPLAEIGLLYEGCGPHPVELILEGEHKNLGATKGRLQEFSDAMNNVIDAGIKPGGPGLIIYKKHK